MKFYTLLALCFLPYCFACQKSKKEDAVNTDDPKNYTIKLEGNWKLSAQVSDIPYDWNGDGTTETNMWAVWSSCGRDVGFNFISGGTGTAKFQCEPAREMTWKVANGSDSIAFTVKSTVSPLFLNFGKRKLAEVNDSLLIIKYMQGISGGTIGIPVTDTYRKQ